MMIIPGLSIFWRSKTSLSIGLDSRTGVLIDELPSAELRFIDRLTQPVIDLEVRRLGKDFKISAKRQDEIIAMLKDAGVLVDDVPALADSAAFLRERKPVPTRRQRVHIHIEHCDYLGAGIALGLAAAGIGIVTTNDNASVGVNDHPQMSGRFIGYPRRHALPTLLREINPQIRTSGKQPHLAVATGSHCVDPLRAGEFLSSGIPTFIAWAEEFDVMCGPLCIPHESTCPACVYHYRCDLDDSWTEIATQAFATYDVCAESSSMNLAVSFAVRDILSFIDGEIPQLTNRLWRIAPSPALPELLEIPPHADCGCQDLPTRSDCSLVDDL